MIDFRITDEQGEKLMKWLDSKGQVYTGAMGGRYTYSFSPTSLGIVVKVKDEVLKDEIDLSDYQDW